ncbi:MAG: 2-dehydro-3-deoxyphosphogluconate aldolase [Planctomycetota bacterium]|nr:MAG: 2-dehydro-3-deoxyphosphogluconate aldolase [Planctomycetota bacterium]
MKPLLSRGRAKQQVLDELHLSGVVAVIRTSEPAAIPAAVEALLSGGLRAIEITLTTPRALGVIRQLRERYCGDILLGAGTVMESVEAAAAIDAGAEYLVSPSIETDVIEECRKQNVVSIPGAYTPTEIRTALKAGADVVKVFPASIGGPGYLRDLAGPLPSARLLPSGGVSFETVGAFFAAGAFAVAVGSTLLDKQLLRDGRFDVIADNTKRFMALVAERRGS